MAACGEESRILWPISDPSAFVQTFLFGPWQLANRARYEVAWEVLMQWCHEHGIMFMQLGEELQGYLLSDCVLGQAGEEVFSLLQVRGMVAVAHKRYRERRRLKVALTVIEGLGLLLLQYDAHL